MNKLNDVRAKYPQYSALPDNVLADKIYQKHYKGVMDRKEFEYRIGVRPLDYGAGDERASGFALSFDDEITAAGQSVGDYAARKLRGKEANLSSLYDSNLKDYRLQQDIYRQENPKTSLANRVVGGAAVGGPVYTSVAQKAGPIVSGMATGATMGGIEGFAGGEGGFKERTKSAAWGAGIGAAVGGLIPAAVMGTKSAVTGIKNALGWVDVPEASLQRILKAMDDDGLTPVEMAQNLEKMYKAGKPAMPADMGDNMRSLGGFVAKQPGAGRKLAKDALQKRQLGQIDRITDDIKKYVSPDDLYTSMDDLIAKRSNDAAPHYQKAYEKNFIWSDRLEELLNRKPVQKALKNAVETIETKGGDPRALGFDFNEAGDVVYLKTPSMEALDYIKRGMDDVIERYRDGTTGKLNLDTKGQHFNALLKDYKNELVRLNPDYGKALKAYSGPSQSMDIIERGRSYQRQNPEEIKRYIKGLSPDDRELYRIGVAQKMIDVAESRVHGADKARALLGSPKKEKALAEVFGGDNKLKGLLNSFDLESTMHRTYAKATGGSPTQPLQAEAGSIPSLDMAQNLARGDYLGAAGSLLRKGSERLSGVNDRTTNEIASVLFQDNPRALVKASSALSKHKTYADEATKATLAKLGIVTAPAAAQSGMFGRKRALNR